MHSRFGNFNHSFHFHIDVSLEVYHEFGVYYELQKKMPNGTCMRHITII